MHAEIWFKFCQVLSYMPSSPLGSISPYRYTIQATATSAFMPVYIIKNCYNIGTVYGSIWEKRGKFRAGCRNFAVKVPMHQGLWVMCRLFRPSTSLMQHQLNL